MEVFISEGCILVGFYARMKSACGVFGSYNCPNVILKDYAKECS